MIVFAVYKTAGKGIHLYSVEGLVSEALKDCASAISEEGDNKYEEKHRPLAMRSVSTSVAGDCATVVVLEDPVTGDASVGCLTTVDSADGGTDASSSRMEHVMGMQRGCFTRPTWCWRTLQAAIVW